MDLRATEGVASRFEAYIEHLRGTIGHADRRMPHAAYCTGFVAAGERKGVEPIVARIAPDEVSAKHQSLHLGSLMTPAFRRRRAPQAKPSVTRLRADAVPGR
jgi:SRSO17 transposase